MPTVRCGARPVAPLAGKVRPFPAMRTTGAVRRTVLGVAAAALLYVAAVAALLALTSFEGRAVWPLLGLITVLSGAAGGRLARSAVRRGTRT